MQAKFNDELKAIAEREGIALFGVADIRSASYTFHLDSKTIDGLSYGISIGYRLSFSILNTVKDQPSAIYSFHYKRVNILLDNTALKISAFIQGAGYAALPIPASQVVDWENHKGHLSHKLVAKMAGLGWIGRSGLLVNPRYGAGVRYTTILTDMPLEPGAELSRHPQGVGGKRYSCDGCSDCITACPVRAIKEKAEDLDLASCLSLLKKFSKMPNIGQFICGVCVRACPGKRQDR